MPLFFFIGESFDFPLVCIPFTSCDSVSLLAALGVEASPSFLTACDGEAEFSLIRFLSKLTQEGGGLRRSPKGKGLLWWFIRPLEVPSTRDFLK